MKQILKNKNNNAIKATFWISIALFLIIVFSISFAFTMAYFYKNQENKGYIQFAPGIYLDFKPDTIQNPENSTQLNLVYYKNQNLTSTPIKFNTSEEPAQPNKMYYLVSPEFRSGKNENNESASFFARCKLEYTDQEGNILTDELMDLIFGQELDADKKGILIEFAEGWEFRSDGYYYYVNTNDVSEGISASNLSLISYEDDAPYIKIFKTNAQGVVELKLANQTLESYELEYNIKKVNVNLIMEFVEVGSTFVDEWFN